MDKLTRHQNNLDAAYEQMLNHADAMSIERENHEEHMLWELKQSNELIREYISSVVALQEFLEWAWEKYQRTLTPQWSQAWEDRRAD